MARESAARSSMRDRAKARTETASHGGGGGSKFKLPEGVDYFKTEHSDRGVTMNLDILPYEITDARHPEVLAGNSGVGDLIDCRFVWVHSNIGAENKSYLCLRTWGQKCPICEAYAAAKKNPNVAPKEAAALKPKERVLYNVIDLDTKEQKIQFWDMSYFNFHELLEEEQKNKEQYYGYAELEDGLTLEVRFKSETMGNSKPFAKASRIDFHPRDPYKDDILKEVVNIDEALVQLSYEQLEKIFLQTDDEPEGGDEPPAGRRGGRQEEEPSRRRREPEAEPERARGRKEPEAEEPARGRRGAREEEPERETRRGRGSEEEPAPRRGRGDREPEPEREPDGKRGRGDHKEDTIHDRDPDKDKASGRHEVDPEQDCEGKTKDGKPGKFGVDIDKLDYCLDCQNWDGCRAEKDRLTRESGERRAGAGKEKEKEPEAGRRGRR